MNVSKIFFSVLIMNLVLATPTYAEHLERKEFNFNFKTEEILTKDEIHYSYQVIPFRTLVDDFPTAFELDSMRIVDEPQVRLMLAKVVYVVNKPIGFFDHEQIQDEKFLRHMLEDQKLVKTESESIKVTVPGPEGYSYKLRHYFDSDDISSLPNSRINQAVTAAKKMDVISQGASSLVLKEYSGFTKHFAGGTQITSYVAMKENSTLVISYYFIGVKTPFDEEQLKSSFIKDIKSTKKLMNDFKN